MQLSGWEAVRYGMLCDAMLEGDAMGGAGCWGGGKWSMVMEENGPVRGCGVTIDERSGLEDWDIAARLEKREKAAGGSADCLG